MYILFCRTFEEYIEEFFGLFIKEIRSNRGPKHVPPVVQAKEPKTTTKKDFQRGPRLVYGEGHGWGNDDDLNDNVLYR